MGKFGKRRRLQRGATVRGFTSAVLIMLSTDTNKGGGGRGNRWAWLIYTKDLLSINKLNHMPSLFCACIENTKVPFQALDVECHPNRH